MIVCPECLLDVSELGGTCLQLLLDILIFEEEDILLAIDTRHRLWRTRKNGYRPSQDINHALGVLERTGFLVSTEITQHIVGVSVNWDRADYDMESETICWCGTEFLE